MDRIVAILHITVIVSFRFGSVPVLSESVHGKISHYSTADFKLNCRKRRMTCGITAATLEHKYTSWVRFCCFLLLGFYKKSLDKMLRFAGYTFIFVFWQFCFDYLGNWTWRSTSNHKFVSYIMGLVLDG